MAKIENIVGEKFVIARAVDMTLHVRPACVVHEVEVGKFRGIGRLLTHPHPDESKLFRHRICPGDRRLRHDTVTVRVEDALTIRSEAQAVIRALQLVGNDLTLGRSEEHTSELQSLMRISYAVFCLQKKKHNNKLKNQDF